MKIKIILFGAVLLYLATSLVTSSPAVSAQQKIILSIDKCIAISEQWKNSGGSDKAYYIKLRTAYKEIESIAVFRYPTLTKTINGGPVPSIETEAAILKIDHPTGLQVLEEAISSDELNDHQKLYQLSQIIKALNQIKTGIKQIPLQDWEILEASHLSITTLITLSLSGFDSPAFDLRFSDAQIVLNHLQLMLKAFQSSEAIIHKIEIAKQQITKANNSETFDYYHLFKEILLPIQIDIKKLHQQLGYEQYSEVTSIPRMISSGEHLFHPNYLSNTYSMRGNYEQLNALQIELGKTLFFDPILSNNNQRTCASCHKPELAYSDGNKTSIGNGFTKSTLRNSPTLINSAYQTSFFADLRSKNMNHQILNVIHDPLEFNTTPDKIIERLNLSTEYKQLFEQAFDGQKSAININNVKAALESFIRTLNTHDSKFDKNIRSELSNYTTEEINGFNLFFGKAQCATCHFAPHFNGLVPPHFTETEGEILGVTTDSLFNNLDTDWGVYRQYGTAYPNAKETKGMFKTPTLRNVSITAPYMHNGAFSSLKTVIEFYNSGGGLGNDLDIAQQTLAPDSLHLSDSEINDLIAFLNSLNDTSGVLVQPFELPIVANDPYANRKWGGEY